MAKGQGVVYIKYVDNNISSGMNGHAVNIFFDVYDFDVDKQSKTVYVDIRNYTRMRYQKVHYQTYRLRRSRD